MPLDAYTLASRVYPVIIACFPALVSWAAWLYPDFGAVASVVGASAVGALILLASQVGRDRGKKLEPGLWTAWGGKPTTQLLRHRSGLTNPTTLARYHQRLGELLGKALPTAAEEADAPEKADEIYDAAVVLLREKTRDRKQYHLVFQENVSYGFRRNLLGLKWVGTFITIAGVGIAVGALWAGCPVGLAFFATAVCVVLLAVWILIVRPAWVKVPAFGYAERLLAACDGELLQKQA